MVSGNLFLSDKKARVTLLTLVLASVVFVFGMYVVFGAHVITFVGGDTTTNVVEDISTFYNISINNSDAGQDANITQVNITLPSGFSFNFGEENGTSATGQFSNTSDTIIWENFTDYLVNGSEIQYIWFNATAANPGNYNISVATTNSSGVYYSNVSVSVNDTTAPTISFGGDSFSNGATLDQTTLLVELNATDNGDLDSIVVTIHYSNGTVINTTLNSSLSNGELYSITFVGLEYGSYMVNASVNDTYGFSNISGNRTVTLANLTEDEEEDESSSSSSGSPTATLAFWTNTYLYNDVEFSEKDPLNRILSEKNRIRLKIGGSTHYVGIVELNSSVVTINVSSTPQQASFIEGQSVRFDVDSSGYYDLLVTLNSISNNKANITLESINELVASEEIEEGEQISDNEIESAETQEGMGEESIDEVVDVNGGTWWIWIIVVIVIVAAGIVVFYYFKMKRESSSRIKRKSKK